VSLRDRDLSLKEAKNLLAENLEDVDRLQNLSNALLELAQYEERSNKQSDETTQLQLAIKESMRTIKPLAQKKAIKIELSPLEVGLKISTKELSDVLTILLDNAIKFSKPKTVIVLTAQKIDGHTRIHVADQGRGIAKHDLEHIFDRFFQVSSSRSSQQQTGNGLGLAIAKKTIERNHGCISVTSSLGKGTTFTIRLNNSW
jgi:signal transduction histidine kinase